MENIDVIEIGNCRLMVDEARNRGVSEKAIQQAREEEGQRKAKGIRHLAPFELTGQPVYYG